MTDKNLLNKLSHLGFPMFEPEESHDVNETLAEAVRSHDTRLWEGFPVLLANAAEDYYFSTSEVEHQLNREKDKEHFHSLLLMSLSLYAFFHLSFPWANKLKKTLPGKDKLLLTKWKNSLAHDKPLSWDNTTFSSERLKRLFELYFEKKAGKDRQRKERLEDFSLEHALSQVFSPKQKELFKKKLEGHMLTKTEQEYYSRTVKKKVVALANSELHSLSRKLLEQ